MSSHAIPQVKVESRQRIGSRYAKRLRDAGRLPAVIYGHQQDPMHVSFNSKEVVTHLLNRAHLLQVSNNGSTESCLVKDVQWNYLGTQIIHIDLARVDLSETVEVEVALEIVGEAVGLKEAGALLSHPLSAIEIECRADQIPEVITLDVSALNVNESITAADLKLPAGVACTMDPETLLASISIQAEEPEEEAVAEAGDGEPEIIGAKEKEDGEAVKD